MLRNKLIGVISAAALLTAFAAGPAMAAAGDLVVTGGSLGFDPAGAPTVSVFAPITLNGAPQLTTASIAPFTVVDGTGSAAGWHVNLTVGDLVNAGSTIQASNITMAAPLVAGVAGTSPAAFTLTAFTGVNGAGTAVKIISAPATAASQGYFVVSPLPLKVVVPSTAIVGTYATTTVVAVVTAP
ncbi:MAG: hypothetical protein JWL83_4553 [Actinomycetia bacterium]|nr:hypothetical protein [Actinomycetes bacterium]